MTILTDKKYITSTHSKVDIECDYKISEKCKNIWSLEYRAALRFQANNDGKDICLYCSRQLKSSGRNNPNCKYKNLDDNLLQNIDTEEKAYLLGLIASDGSIGKQNSCTIEIHEKDYDLLEKLKNILNLDCLLKHDEHRKRAILTISSKTILNDVKKYLNIPKDIFALSHNICFPKLDNEKLQYAFIRGFFDGDGCIEDIRKEKLTPSCNFTSKSHNFLVDLAKYVNIPYYEYEDCIYYTGTNCIDLLGKIYNNAIIYLDRKYEIYKLWSNYITNIGIGGWIKCPSFNFKYKLLDENAEHPFKKNESDSGFDLTLIKKIKDINNIQYYDTGITLMPDFGYYFELVARSSLHKYGYMLANSIGIIDASYRGNIIAVLYKFDTSLPDLKLPGRYVQIIPRVVSNLTPVHEELLFSSRNTGGFGSTGV